MLLWSEAELLSTWPNDTERSWLSPSVKMNSRHTLDSHGEPLLEQHAQDFELADVDGEQAQNDHLNSVTKTSPKTKISPWLVAVTVFIIVLAFTINTESTAYFEDVLGWNKPCATLYITHSCLALPWLCHLAYLRFQDRQLPYKIWVKNYNNQLRGAISSVDAYATNGPWMLFKFHGHVAGPLDFLATAMAIITIVLTASGLSWFVALSLTTPSDLTAIYNCSTFFAAAFSVPLLKEKLGRFSIVAVALSILGTFIIAYGDTTAEHSADEKLGTSRFLGNLIACGGAVAFGLYEVLLKKWACSSRPMSAGASLPLTLAASALTGVYTFFTLWAALIILHIFRIETLVWPSANVAMWIAISVLSGAFGITLLVVLVIWTDPIFGSMANVLSVLSVAMADWVVFGLKPSVATYTGGGVVLVAFGLMAWDTFRAKRR